MIQANELRLNNKVLWDGKICTVKGISYFIDADADNEGYIFDLYIGRELVQTPYEKDIEPIIITPKILKKCGFKTKTEIPPYTYYHPNESAMWGVRQEGNGKWQFCIIVRLDEIWKFNPIIENLHQLQNLYFALTGEELQLNL